MTPPENAQPNLDEQRTGQPIELVREAFEAEWRAGQTPSIEDYVRGSSAAHRGALVRELVALEVEYRHRAGEQPEASEYLERFAEFADDLSALFEKQSQTAAGGDVNAGATTQVYRPKGSDPDDADATLPPPDGSARSSQGAGPLVSWDDYEVLDEIARGGMGVVYRARQKGPNRIVALKMIQAGQLANEEEISRFRTEAEAAASLDHPNIVPVYDVGEHLGHHYFSMGYVEGANLRSRVLDGPLANREAARIVKIVSEAMAYAHDKGIIHRDLKPENVLLDQAGQPKITDFGLAKQIESDSNLTATGQVLGTPSYMSPEQAGGRLEEIGPASDVYSVGAILYCLLTGRPPFQAAHVLDTLLQVMQKEPVSPRELNPAVDRDLETLCLKCLDKEPDRRVASAGELAEELGRYLEGQPIHARPLGRPTRMWRWCRRNRLVTSLTTLAVVALIAGASVSTYFAFLARERAVRAEEGTRIAVGTLQSVIHKVQQDLKPFAEARDVRRELLLESVRDLDRLSTEFADATSVDLSTATALSDLGRLFEELGAELGEGSSAAAERNYLRAIEISRQLVAQEPSDSAVRLALTKPLEHLGNLYLYNGRVAEAEAPLDESLSIRRSLLEAEAASIEHRTHTAWALMNYGDVKHGKKQFRKARKLFQEAVGLGQEVLDAEPDNPANSEMLLVAYEKYGDACIDAGDVATAKAAYESEYSIAESLHNRYPDNAQCMLSLSSACERIGNVREKAGDRRGARRMYERGLELSERMVQADSNNLQLQEALATACEQVGFITLDLKDFEASQRAFQRAVDVLKPLIEQDSSNTDLQRFLRRMEGQLRGVEKRVAADGRASP